MSAHPGQERAGTFELGAAGRGGRNEAAAPTTWGMDGIRAELYAFDSD